MRFPGKLTKSGRWYAAEVPLLGIHTQGKTKVNAYVMVKDAIESLVDSSGFQAFVYPGRGDYFEVGANNQADWIAFLLRRQRMVHGLSLADVAERLGAKSRNAYARYEQGKSVPAADKLMELLAALAPERDLVLDESGARAQRGS
jgi:hypothetical protein